MKIKPIIKYSGSKRHVAHFLNGLFPKEYSRYFEPFVGGGSMLPHIKCKEIYASDIMPFLVELWNQIKNNPHFVKFQYRELWNQLQSDNDFYYTVRDRFNKDKNPFDFLFLTRTCYNGLIRFNKNNEFNSSFHLNRRGINPDKFDKIVDEWSGKHLINVNFSCRDYYTILSGVKQGDFVFLDPPYQNITSQYLSDAASFDYERFECFLDILNQKKVNWLLTLGQSDTLSEKLFAWRGQTRKMTSSFRRLKNKNDYIGDSVYTNYIPKEEKHE